MFKYLSLCIALISGCFLSSYGQEEVSVAQGMYLRVGGGYAGSVTKDAMADPFLQTFGRTNDADSIKIGVIYTTSGAGVGANLAFGYMIKDFIGVELGASFLYGNKELVQSRQEDNFKLEGTYQSLLVNLKPAVVVAGGTDKYRIYARTGLIIPLIGETRNDVYSEQDKNLDGIFNGAGDETIELRRIISGNFSIGFTGALGFSYRVTPFMEVFAEVEGINLRIKSKDAYLKKYIINGQDGLNDLPVVSRDWIFKDDVKYSDPSFPDLGDGTKPLVVERRTSNYSSLGATVGVSFLFRKSAN